MKMIDNLRSNGFYSADITGALDSVILAGTTATLDYPLTEDRAIDGADYEAIYRNTDDRISFQIVDPAGNILNQFANRLFVREKYTKQLYGAFINAGLIIRVIYENNGTNDVHFNINFHLHRVIE